MGLLNLFEKKEQDPEVVWFKEIIKNLSKMDKRFKVESPKEHPNVFIIKNEKIGVIRGQFFSGMGIYFDLLHPVPKSDGDINLEVLKTINDVLVIGTVGSVSMELESVEDDNDAEDYILRYNTVYPIFVDGKESNGYSDTDARDGNLAKCLLRLVKGINMVDGSELLDHIQE